jgi:hypothetical protein
MALDIFNENLLYKVEKLFLPIFSASIYKTLEVHIFRCSLDFLRAPKSSYFNNKTRYQP